MADQNHSNALANTQHNKNLIEIGYIYVYLNGEYPYTDQKVCSKLILMQNKLTKCRKIRLLANG